MKTTLTVMAALALCVIPAAAKKTPKVTVQLKDAKGGSVGTATISATGSKGVSIKSVSYTHLKW